jgi:hypothetical protein
MQPLYKQTAENAKTLKVELETVRADNLSLMKKTQNDSTDKMCLLDKIDQLEMQIVAVTEKHKICQKEVIFFPVRPDSFSLFTNPTQLQDRPKRPFVDQTTSRPELDARKV